MKRKVLTILILMISLGLMSLRYSSSYDLEGNEISGRSTDPRITEIAHVTSNPVLTSNEQQAKLLWDSLFETLCTKNLSEYEQNFIYTTDVNYWKEFTPKELITKQYNGAHVFYMQNLRTFHVANYMCATYNNKVYLLPLHLNHLMDDMGEIMNSNNIYNYTNLFLKLSTSSSITVLDSTIVLSDSTMTMINYDFEEERNGAVHSKTFLLSPSQGVISGFLWDSCYSEYNSNHRNTINDTDPRNYEFFKSNFYPIQCPLSNSLNPVLYIN